ncbi:uncharacterized protein TNCV_895841 [Trichonephila clavipes]|nr:uncharacterized protein TNCV_895841 [Trichonephila clavipes]
MSSFKKYKCLTISEKQKVIESVEKGEKVNVAKAFDIPLFPILKNQEKIIGASLSTVRKLFSKGNFSHLEQCLVKWIKQCQGQNIPIGDFLLKEKAKAFAKELGIDFLASEDLMKEYDPCNFFNTDETGLFFKCMSKKYLHLKKKKCHGEKHSKKSLTVLLAVNSSGSEKITPLVIGKSANPSVFQGHKLVLYHIPLKQEGMDDHQTI